MDEIIFRPTPKQADALERVEFEILFGGARGGGKTDAGLAWNTYDIDNERLRSLVIRRNADDLKDWSARANFMYKQLGCTKKGNPAEFHFPSGAAIMTGHLKDENAYEKYQGHEYQKMTIEELNQIPSEQSYLKLISSCRSTVTGLKPQVFCTANPGGPGHAWVKQRWNIPDRPTGIVVTKDEVSGRSRVFIPSTIDDNPYLMEKDPDYACFLDSLPEGLREQWRMGYWEDVEIKGAYYAKLINIAENSGRIARVSYDEALPTYTIWDLGVNDTTAIWFVQIYGKEVRVIDCYENSGEGLPHYLAVIRERGYIYEMHYFPHDLAVREFTTGASREDKLKEYGLKNYKIVPKLSIEDGIDAVRTTLPYCIFDKEKCAEGISALKNYRKEWDEIRLVYRNHPVHDWSSNFADAFRYMAISMKDRLQIKSAPQSGILLPNRPNTINRVTGQNIPSRPIQSNSFIIR